MADRVIGDSATVFETNVTESDISRLTRMMKNCPNLANLKSFLDSELPVGLHESHAQHIDDCENCQDLLEELTRSDLFFESQSPEFDPALEVLVDRLSHRFCREIDKPAHGNGRQNRNVLPPFTSIGDYELEECIGIGGMGVVYRARHTKLDRVVAVKIFEEETTFGEVDKDGRLSRFRRELKAIGRLNHPNIVNAFDAGEFGKYHYLAMEYVDGINLQQWVHQNGPLRVADACEIIRQAANGLQHSFESGLIHRDIKPSNIMVSVAGDSSTVKVLDLGLARFHDLTESCEDALSQDGVILGTFNFMAPEQLNGSDVDVRVDVYGLGATLFFLLTGQSHLPDSTDNLLDKIRVRATRPNRSLSDFGQKFPTELVEIVDSMLHKEARNRHSSPGEVSAVLRTFCKGSDLQDYLPGRQVDTDCETVKLATPATQNQSVARAIEHSWPKPSPAGVRSWGLGSQRWLWTGLIIAFTALAGIVIRLQTDGGEIVIQCDDPNLEIAIVQNDKVIQSIEVGQLKDYSWYRSGSYEIRIPHDKRDSLVIENNKFTLNRGGKQIVNIVEVKQADRAKSDLRPTSQAKGKYVVWEFPDGGRYIKNPNGSWSVHFARGGTREVAVSQISKGDQLPMIVNDPYHKLWFRFSETTVDVSDNEGETWAPFYSGKGKWIPQG